MALPSGTRLEEFEVQSLLGIGGFGIVYLAQDHALGRLVALKEYMPTSLALREASSSQVQVRTSADLSTFELGMRSFVNEARLLAKFDHRSLLKVYRFWQANGTAYMVTPYYQGLTLAQARDANSLAAMGPRLRPLLTSVGGALRVLHEEHVYHRDVAPDNIFLLPDGNPVLLDFGAARAVIGERTQSLTAILKPSFAPVEQYSQSGVLRQGPWTDLYALGGVMVYCVTGKTPSPSVSRAIADDYEPLADRLASHPEWGVDMAFCRAVDWCLRVRPQERPQSVDELMAVINGEADAPISPTESSFMIASTTGERTDARASTVPLDAKTMAQVAASAGPAGVTAFAKTTVASSAPAAAASKSAATASAQVAPSAAESEFEATRVEESSLEASAAQDDATQPSRKGLWMGLGGVLIAGLAAWGLMKRETPAVIGAPMAVASSAAFATTTVATVATISAATATTTANASTTATIAPSASAAQTTATATASLASSASASLASSTLQTASATAKTAASKPTQTAAITALAAASAARAAAAKRSATLALTASKLLPPKATETTAAAGNANAPAGVAAAVPEIRAASRPVAPPVAAPAPAPRVALDPDSVCADRILLGRHLCLSRTCRLPAFEKHPDCVSLRDIEDSRAAPGQSR